MNKQIKNTEETDWGFHVELQDNVIIDDNNIIETMESIILGCKDAGKKRILIDASTTIRNASIFKMLEVAHLIENMGCWGLHIAFITPELTENENSRFMENASHNRGSYIQYFKTKEEALEWLLK